MAASVQLREHGFVVLRNIFESHSLAPLKQAALRCLERIESEPSVPEHYRFNPVSWSVLLTALLDFGCGSGQLLAPLNAPALRQLFAETKASKWACKLEHSWLRKKFPPRKSPSLACRPQDWHQDGALGVSFPIEPGPVIPITDLLTCWIPLNPCGQDSPGLEFIRGPQPALLHFTELDNASLRRRFDPQRFHAPELEWGDALVFLNTVLHRTHTLRGMSQERLSVEYRIFPL